MERCEKVLAHFRTAIADDRSSAGERVQYEYERSQWPSANSEDQGPIEEQQGNVELADCRA